MLEDEASGVCGECLAEEPTDASNSNPDEADLIPTDSEGNSFENTGTEEAESSEDGLLPDRFWDDVSTDDIDIRTEDIQSESTDTNRTQSTDPLDKRIDSWKEQLLDLTRRNKLVNFKETKSKSLPLHQPDALAIGEKLLQDDPIYIRKSDSADYGGSPPDSADLKANEIASTRSVEATLSSLQSLRLNQRRARQERGVDALYLSFCTLRWYDIGHSDEPLRSPLFLLSVDLTRETNNSADRHDFELTPVDIDLQINPALRKKLQSERDLALPPDEAFSLENLGSSVKAIEDIIQGFSRWEINGEVLLGVFDFTKIGLYADIEENREAVKDHGLIKAMNGDLSGLSEPPDSPSADELDQEVSPAETYQVLDADSSQQEAIEAAKRGMDFVLQGPPGTGKSQTISNIIAEKLADGETVLFVSEKQAALDVVKNRLDDVGLGRFCLEAHADKANKEAVLESLAAELRSDPIRYPEDRDMVTSELETVRRDLNAYGETLFFTPDNQDTTVYQAMGLVSENSEAPTVSFDVRNPLGMSGSRIDSMEDALKSLSGYEYEVSEYRTHPWRHTKLDKWRINTSEKVTNALADAKTATTRMAELSGHLEERLNVSIENVADFQAASHVIDLLTDLPDAPLEERFFDRAFYAREERLQSFIELESNITALRTELDTQYNQSYFSEDGSELHSDLSGYGFFKSVRPSYRSLRSRILDHTEADYDPDYEELVEDAQQLAEFQTLKAERSEFSSIQSQLGFLYNGPESDWDRILELQEWIAEFRAIESIQTDSIEDRLLREEFDGFEPRFVNAIEEAIASFESASRDLEEIIEIDELQVRGGSFTEAPLSDITREIEMLENSIDDLQRWVQFSQRLDNARENFDHLDRYLEQFLAEEHDASELVPAFIKTFYTEWLNEVYDRTSLGSFSSTEVDQQLQKFRQLDRQQQEYAKVAIQHEVTKRHPRMELSHAKNSEQTVLRREINKSQRHIPLRKLFEESASLVTTLKPCFMMSPLSVAQYLQYGTIEFDAVIFDEASQIMPQDAVSSLIRGNQTIIAGDTKQLPPTSFFNADVESADGVMDDLESILDEAASVLPERNLRWHYRSNTNELIEFSNQKYYDSRLKTFPGNAGDDEGMGVEFEYVEDGLYDRGGSSTNEPEAKRVVDLIEKHVENRSDESLGVVAFSQAQAGAIRDELENRRKTTPVLSAFIDDDDALEGFFVKSLENVQGDERDRLIFSIGYGPDYAGRVSMNFGPMNNAGGERRLNVAVTRSRNQITVVSSIRHSDIDTSKTTNAGVEDFKHYLRYAEEGEQALRREDTTSAADHFDSGFEKAVCEALRDRGHTVDTQVQSAGYSIDLGIKHPEKPGKYILGIECDGAAYHSSRTARDRDRTRQAVLEDLGWQIHRIWSPDWTANQDAQLDKIDERVESLLATSSGQSVTADGGTSSFTPSVEEIDPMPIAPSELGGYQSEIVDYEEPQKVATHWGEFDDASHRKIAQNLVELVEQYGPIEEELAYRTVIEGWDVSRLGKNIRRKMKKIASQMDSQGHIRWNQGFFWPADEGEILVRQNTQSQNRDIEQVPLEEIEKGAFILLDEGGNMSREDLVTETTRLLGYDRTGKRIQERVQDAVSRLEAANAVEIDGELLKARDVEPDEIMYPR